MIDFSRQSRVACIVFRDKIDLRTALMNDAFSKNYRI